MGRKLLLIGVCLAMTIMSVGCFSAGANECKLCKWSISGGNGRTFATELRLCGDIDSLWDIRLVNGVAWTNLVSDGKYVYALINGADGYEVVKIRIDTGGVIVSGEDPVELMISALLGGDIKHKIHPTVFRDVPDDVSFQLTLENGILILLSESEIIAIETDGMRALWREKTRTNNIESICAVGDRVICTTSFGCVKALSARTGMPLWEQSLDDSYDFQFITAGENVALVYGFSKGAGVSMTVAVSIHDGTVLWNKESLGVATKPPQIHGGNAYISESGKFSCLDIRNGEEIWSPLFEVQVPETEGQEGQDDRVDNQESSIHARIVLTPALTDDFAFIVVDDQLKVISMKNGRQEDYLVLPEDIMPKFLLASDDYLYLVTDGEPFMYQYDVASLELERRFVGGSREVISAMITDVIILQTRESVVCYGCE